MFDLLLRHTTRHIIRESILQHSESAQNCHGTLFERHSRDANVRRDAPSVTCSGYLSASKKTPTTTLLLSRSMCADTEKEGACELSRRSDCMCTVGDVVVWLGHDEKRVRCPHRSVNGQHFLECSGLHFLTAALASYFEGTSWLWGAFARVRVSSLWSDWCSSVCANRGFMAGRALGRCPMELPKRCSCDWSENIANCLCLCVRHLRIRLVCQFVRAYFSVFASGSILFFFLFHVPFFV